MYTAAMIVIWGTAGILLGSLIVFMVAAVRDGIKSGGTTALIVFVWLALLIISVGYVSQYPR